MITGSSVAWLTTLVGTQTLTVRQSSLMPAFLIMNSGSLVRIIAGHTEMYCQHKGGSAVALMMGSSLILGSYGRGGSQWKSPTGGFA